MYCSSCGAESTRGLSHCRVCGANLNPPAGARVPSEAPGPVKVPGAFIFLFLVTALVGLLGFFGIFGAVINIRFLSLPPDVIKKVLALILIFGTFSIVGVVAVLSHVLLRVFGFSAKPHAPAQAVRTAPIEHPPAQIHAPPMMQSVTEHTTRNFESPLRREPGMRE
ncbi:MAG TPA: hypothetical protein VE262_16305 [Blastocatellia bacterium]|nr:hypothetical protein [Blastocatellia bacterium]